MYTVYKLVLRLYLQEEVDTSTVKAASFIYYTINQLQLAAWLSG